MRRVLLILFLIPAFGRVVSSAPDDRFLGGAHDGWARSAYIQFSATANSQIFRGGHYDGAAAGSFMQYDYDNSPQRVSPRFFGGIKDGSAQHRFSQFDRDASPVYISARFLGGSFDGAAAGSATNIINPLVAASDGDAVPDWWEAQYYSDLSTRSDDDTDGDGFTTIEEYIADTQPTNSASRFEIIQLSSVTGSTVISFSSRDTRLYDVYCRSTNAAVWQPVFSYTNVPGNESGTNILNIPRTNSSGYYHVRVKNSH